MPSLSDLRRAGFGSRQSKLLLAALAEPETPSGGGDTAWTFPTIGLSSGWGNMPNDPVGYYKDALGIVHFRGAMRFGSPGFTWLVLPVGYRPAVTQQFLILTEPNVMTSVVTVGTDGSCGYAGGAGATTGNSRLGLVKFPVA